MYNVDLKQKSNKKIQKKRLIPIHFISFKQRLLIDTGVISELWCEVLSFP